MKATITTSACILVTVLALVQLPAFNARDLKDGKHPRKDLGTSAQYQTPDRAPADMAVPQSHIHRQLLQSSAAATAAAVSNAYSAAAAASAAAQRASAAASAASSASAGSAGSSGMPTTLATQLLIGQLAKQHLTSC